MHRTEVVKTNNTRQATRTFNGNTVIEHLDLNIRAFDAVITVSNGIDYAFFPSKFRIFGSGNEATVFSEFCPFFNLTSDKIQRLTDNIENTQQKTALEEMQTKLIMSRTTTMMSQIRSHFVFNLLNAVSGMCKYDPEKADDTIVRFARYLRSNIDIMENDTNIPFATDLRQLEDYVMLEQVRFGDKIEFYTDIEVNRFMIPPLILQPVVENAIKHGISKKLTNGTIILRTRDVGNHIVITVEDDGVGFPMEALENEKSVGLRNIRFRLQHLVGGQLDIQSQVGVGTTVTITIPKER